MKYAVTLEQLRTGRACYSGYNKVVRALQGKDFSEDDAERKSYIRFAHADQIPLARIVNSNGIEDAIWCLKLIPDNERDARLFAVWCARQVEHLMTDQRSKDALDIAERHANRLATDDELDAACSAAWSAAWAAARDAAWSAARDTARDAARAAAWAAARDTARDAAWAAARDAAWAAARDAAWSAAWAAQKEMFIKMCDGEAPWQIEA